jgi:hypothetical protein
MSPLWSDLALARAALADAAARGLIDKSDPLQLRPKEQRKAVRRPVRGPLRSSFAL